MKQLTYELDNLQPIIDSGSYRRPNILRKTIASVGLTAVLLTGACTPNPEEPGNTTTSSTTSTTEAPTTTEVPSTTTTTEAPTVWISWGSTKSYYAEDLGPAEWQTRFVTCDPLLCAARLDPEWNGNSLINPQLNLEADFSEYPAQNLCKNVGGRLPTVDEAFSLAQNADLIRQGYSGRHWTSRETNAANAWYVDGNVASGFNGDIPGDKMAQYLVRCVKDQIN